MQQCLAAVKWLYTGVLAYLLIGAWHFAWSVLVPGGSLQTDGCDWRKKLAVMQ